MAYREDIGSLLPPRRLPDGRLRADGWLTRSGVFVYLDAQGKSRREYRPPDEVFHADSLSAWALTPVTYDHPQEFVTAQNARKYAVGAVGESVRRDGNHIAASLVVFDADTVAKMDNGKVQLSCGYLVDVEETPGTTPDGEAYDAVQRNIRANHVAIVDVGRAGSARVRMDSRLPAEFGGGAWMVDPGQQVSRAVARIDEAQMEELQKKLDAALARIAELETARQDAAATELAAERKRADTLEAERDALKAQLDAAEKARKDAADSFSSQVRARVDLEGAARQVLGADADLAAMTDREIRVAVVKKTDGVEVPAEKSDDYVTARYDAAIERAGKAAAALGNVRTIAEAGRQDAGDPETAARQKMIERNRTAWQQPAQVVKGA